MSGSPSSNPGDLILATFLSPQSFLLVSDKHRSVAERLFGCLGVQVVNGHHFLSGYLGDSSDWVDYVRESSDMGFPFVVPYCGC